MLHLDTYKTKGLRKVLAEELKNKGITSIPVLSAIEKIPRHLFIDSSFVEFAYQDKAFPIGEGQTISQPFTVAKQSELLHVNPQEKILEIGTGSGYQACVLLELGAKVFTIERQRNLYLKTKDLFKTLNYHPKCFYGDGYAGLPNFAPFDKIIVTCGAPFVPEPLKQQLKVGGIMVIPVGENAQQMHVYTKLSDTEFSCDEHGEFRFVPMLESRK
ncbi:MAG: protein-L-isoaspartate(D-aspartate) O-methyltransferase [Bacteroidales bacterium]|jgi:protein-L-isoaspartate(D-aspartate) O-methyltransferase|nr:protein-L-isoaspartate(D-aspartate) O-methyltransferase [Bacteroidales bacterium]